MFLFGAANRKGSPIGLTALRADFSLAAESVCKSIGHDSRDSRVFASAGTIVAAARMLEIDPAFTISAFIARARQSNVKLFIDKVYQNGLRRLSVRLSRSPIRTRQRFQDWAPL
jgi:hypothetical protein